MNQTPHLRLFANRLGAHSRMSSQESEALSELPAHPVQVSTNRDFVRLGERVDHACFVVEGLVGRFSQDRNGARQIISVHISGDMVDLNSVVEPVADSALQALSVTTLLQVPHAALLDLSRQFPAIAEAFWRECVIDAAIVSEWVVNVGRRNALSRIAHLLCEMACRYRGAGAGADMDYHFAATQNQIADMTSLTSVHVNRTLMTLKHAEIVTFSHGRVRIGNWDELARIADFDPTYLHDRAAGCNSRRVLELV